MVSPYIVNLMQQNIMVTKAPEILYIQYKNFQDFHVNFNSLTFLLVMPSKGINPKHCPIIIKNLMFSWKLLFWNEDILASGSIASATSDCVFFRIFIVNVSKRFQEIWLWSSKLRPFYAATLINSTLIYLSANRFFSEALIRKICLRILSVGSTW